MNVRAELKGLRETQKRMTEAVQQLAGPGLIQPMRDAILPVQRDARINAPVDRGVGRASITPEVRVSNVVEGVVGSNRAYMAAQETGTKPFWPPIAALEVWARRHNTSAFLVARAISRRGIIAKRYLQRALESNAARIVKTLGDGVSAIIRKANNQ